ncbi:MAG: hypothetical protein ACRDNT_09500, partial [Streptosporangiaceae bacterium]
MSATEPRGRGAAWTEEPVFGDEGRRYLEAPRRREESTVLELERVTKEYPGSPPVRALDRVSVAVAAGELAAVTGPSGSGKS